MFSTPTSWPTPSAASGDKGLGGGSPVFPSPTKLQNNGLDGEELGTEILSVSFLCELLAIVVKFMFRSTIYRLEARSENAIGAQGGHAKFHGDSVD